MTIFTGIERFDSKVSVAASGCWEWQAWIKSDGYGQFWHEGSLIGAHRFAYLRIVGEIAAGLHLDHLCRNRKCVNPAHLEPVTIKENIRRGVSANRSKTHCPKGHPYDEVNTYPRPDNGRDCRTCRSARANQSRRRAGVTR